MILSIALWVMIVAQLVVWGWFSKKGGQLADKKFLLFTLGMLLGQLAGAIETYQSGAAWRTFIIQVYFFVFTIYGGIQRWKKMRRSA